MVAALFPSLAACSLIYASDLDDARRGASTPSGDAAVEGGGTGVAPGPDAGCGAYPDAGFCDDFDTTANVAERWDALVSDDATHAGYDSLAYSGARSFLASERDAPDCSYARLEKRWRGIGTTRVTVSARVRPSEAWKGSHPLLTLVYGGCAALLYLSDDAPSYSSGVNAQHGTPLENDYRDVDGFPAPGEWTDVTVDAASVPGGGVRVEVVFVHPSGKTDRKAQTFAQCSLAGELSLGLGLHCASGSRDVRYDDVRVSWQ